MKDLKLAIKNLSSGIRKRELRKSDHVIVAKIIDLGPIADGFLIAQLEDGSAINVHAWNGLKLAVGQSIAITRVSDHNWNNFFALGVNASTDTGTTAYTPPELAAGSLAVHDLAGDRHSGSLPWARIDTSGTKVDLSTQVTGILPAANLALLPEQIVSFDVPLAAGASLTGMADACTRGLGLRLSVTGGTSFTLALHSDLARTQLEYATTTAVASPYLDPMLWSRHAAAAKAYWSVTNDGPASAVFSVAITYLVIEP